VIPGPATVFERRKEPKATVMLLAILTAHRKEGWQFTVPTAARLTPEGLHDMHVEAMKRLRAFDPNKTPFALREEVNHIFMCMVMLESKFPENAVLFDPVRREFLISHAEGNSPSSSLSIAECMDMLNADRLKKKKQELEEKMAGKKEGEAVWVVGEGVAWRALHATDDVDDAARHACREGVEVALVPFVKRKELL